MFGGSRLLLPVLRTALQALILFQEQERSSIKHQNKCYRSENARLLAAEDAVALCLFSMVVEMVINSYGYGTDFTGNNRIKKSWQQIIFIVSLIN